MGATPKVDRGAKGKESYSLEALRQWSTQARGREGTACEVLRVWGPWGVWAPWSGSSRVTLLAPVQGQGPFQTQHLKQPKPIPGRHVYQRPKDFVTDLQVLLSSPLDRGEN